MNDASTPTTTAAAAHVAVQRRDTTREATWFDVAAAFDAGVKFSCSHRQLARDQIRDRDAELAGRAR